MELWLILKILLRRWYLVVIPTVIVAAVTVPDLLADAPAGNGGFSTVVRYTAAQELEAIPNRDGDYQDVWLASELTVNAFTDWVRTEKFAEEIATVTASNGLEIDPATLSISADNARSIGQIFINWGNDAELATIADAAIAVLQTRSQEYFPQLGDAPAQVTLLDVPQISPAPPPVTSRLRPLIQLVLGVLAGVGLAFLVEYLDPTLRDRAELDGMGVTVIGIVPRR